MRVTHLGAHQSALTRIKSRLSAYSGTQEQLASGKKLRRPSDDPMGMNRALELRASLRAREQEARNAADGKMWTDLADSKLQGVVDQLQRARELAVRGATYVSSQEREAIALEIGQLRDDVVSLANSQHQGRGLFSGFVAGDAVQKVAGTWTYIGDAGEINRRVAENELVAVNVTADVAFGFTAGKDLFTVLDDLETALQANDTPGIEVAIADVDDSLQNVLGGLGILGARAKRIETAITRNLSDKIILTEELSSLEDVDIAEAIMELQLQETAYEAALAAFAKSSQTSLVDFLR